MKRPLWQQGDMLLPRILPNCLEWQLPDTLSYSMHAENGPELVCSNVSLDMR